MARIGLTLAGLGAAALLTACGGSDGSAGGESDPGFADKSADDIVATAKADMGKLTAVKIAGSVETDGDKIDLDIQANADGDCTGSIGIAGGATEILGVDGTTWIKPDDAFWQASAGAGAEEIIGVVGDKWVVVPADDESFSSFCDVDKLIDQLLEDDEEDGSTYSKAGTEDVDGQSTIKIDNTDPEDGVSTGYVLVDSPHYLVKLEKTDGEDTGSIGFSAFDEEFEVEAPAEDEVIDLDELDS